jgi:hypothetical protein
VRIPNDVRRRPAPARARRGASASTQVVLVAVALVLVFVSLSRLHIFAVHENERDAVRLLGQLGPSAVQAAEAVLPGATAPPLRELVAERIEQARLSDIGWLGQGHALRRHGYLFELRRAADGAWCLLGFPWTAGRTGKAVYVYHAELGLRGHPNAEGRWEAGPLEAGAADAPPRPAPPELNPATWLELERLDRALPRDGQQR